MNAILEQLLHDLANKLQVIESLVFIMLAPEHAAAHPIIIELGRAEGLLERLRDIVRQQRQLFEPDRKQKKTA